VAETTNKPHPLGRIVARREDTCGPVELDPEGSEVQKTIRAMKRAVKEHNKKLNQ